MVLRRLLVAAVCVTVAFGAFSASASTSTSADQASVYRLRSDPRLCPSPMCGGFWASRVNRTSTACRDGAAHAACYIASVDLSGLPADARVRARSALGSGRALVSGAFAAYSSNEFPQLAKLMADRVWLAARTNHEIGTVYRIVDTGLRCIRAPCFSLRATVVNGTHSLTLSSLDLTRTGASAAAISRAHAALTGSGALAAGVVRATSKPGFPGAGRTLVATQVWLPA